MTRDALLDKAGVKPTTGRRVVEKLVKKGRLVQIGTGKRGDPYRLWRGKETE